MFEQVMEMKKRGPKVKHNKAGIRVNQLWQAEGGRKIKYAGNGDLQESADRHSSMLASVNNLVSTWKYVNQVDKFISLIDENVQKFINQLGSDCHFTLSSMLGLDS